MNWLAAFLYGLVLIWTGLHRGIDAAAYKPNALWFCMVLGLMSIAASYLYRLNLRWVASGLVSVAAITALSFYLYCFITQPEKDANFRIGVVILASIAQLAYAWLPREK